MTKISKKIGKMWKDMTGVSPIIAVILMVAITVVLAATIYVWVTGFGGGSQTALSMDLQQTAGTSGTDAIFRVTSASPDLDWSDLTFKIGGTTITTVYSGTSGTTALSGAVNAGDYIRVVSSSCTDGAVLEIIYQNSVIDSETLNY